MYSQIRGVLRVLPDFESNCTPSIQVEVSTIVGTSFQSYSPTIIDITLHAQRYKRGSGI